MRNEQRGNVPTGQDVRQVSGWIQITGLWGLLVAASLAAHSGAMTSPLTWEEQRFLTANPALERVGAWYRPWSEWPAVSRQPLASSWLAVEGRWLGTEVVAHRLVGQALHLACVVMLWQMARRIGHPAGWLAALAWAVHPVAVDAATWIPGRGGLLAALGMLISAGSFLRIGGERGDRVEARARDASGAEPDRGPAIGWLVVCWIAAVMAVLADTTALALPVVLWGLARTGHGRLRGLERVAVGGACALSLATTAGWWLVDWRQWGASTVTDWLTGVGPQVVRHGVSTVWPERYGFTLPRGPLWEGVTWSSWAVTGGLCLAWAWVGWRLRSTRSSRLAWGAGSTVALWMASGLPSAGWEQAPAAAARGYAGLAACCLAITTAWPKNVERAEGSRRLIAMVLGMLVGAWLLLAGNQRAAAWRDGERLWQLTLNRDAESWLALMNLAQRASLSGKSQVAIQRLEQARRLAPEATEAEAFFAQVLAAGGQWSQAEDHLMRARERAPHDARLALALGDVYRLQGDAVRAITAYAEAVAAEPRWPRPLVAEASVQSERGNGNEAVATAQRAAALAPGTSWIRLALAGIRRDAGDLAGAEQEFRRVLRAHPHEVEALLGVADVLLRSGRAEEAEVPLRVAEIELAEDDRRRSAWTVLSAELRRQHGDRPGTDALLQEALRIDPGNAEAYVVLGRLSEDTGDDRAAAAAYRQAWQRAPHRSDIRQRLAESYRAVGQWAEAELLFQQMVARRPLSADGYLGLGRVAAAKGELATAETYFEQALARDATSAEAALEMGIVRERQMQPEEAIAAYRQAVAARPAWAVAQKHLGTLLAQQNVPFEAIAALRKAVALDPNYGEAHRVLATVLAMQGSLDEAARHFREAARLEPQDAALRYNLGTLLGQRGHAEEALAELREALRLRPDYPEAQHNLAVLLAQAGKVAEASAAYQVALRLNPEHAEAHGNYAQLLLKQGLIEEALAHLRESLRIRPEQPVLQGRLAWLLATVPLDRLRSGADAVRLAEAACAASERQDARLLDVLAASYAEAGRFDEAVATAREALARLAGMGNPQLAEGVAGRLKQYESHNPHRESP